jgi:MYXO-CTERM domain-containing protein
LRIGLLALIAAAVVGGFVPHAALSAAESTGAQMEQLAESPVATPSACTDVTCGKGTPATASPSPAVVLAVVIGGVALAALAASAVRRRRRQVAPLPAGTRDPLFHPPQFS